MAEMKIVSGLACRHCYRMLIPIQGGRYLYHPQCDDCDDSTKHFDPPSVVVDEMWVSKETEAQSLKETTGAQPGKG